MKISKNNDCEAPIPQLRVAEVIAQPFRHGSLFSGIGGLLIPVIILSL